MTTSRFAPGPRPLAASLRRATRPLLKKRGFGGGEILSHWTDIVGEQLARHCVPERVMWSRQSAGGAWLRVRVQSAFAPELQHLEPLILERVNGYYGYQAIAGLKMVQGPVPPPPVSKERPRRTLTKTEERRLKDCLGVVRDPNLRAALETLGRSLIAAGPADDSGG